MCVGFFIALLDIQIVSASLKDIGGGLSANQDEIAWVQTSYLIAEIVVIPLSGFPAIRGRSGGHADARRPVAGEAEARLGPVQPDAQSRAPHRHPSPRPHPPRSTPPAITDT